MKEAHPYYSEIQICDVIRRTFVEWFHEHVTTLDRSPTQKRLKELSYGPVALAMSYKGCIANGYRFHSKESNNDGLSTQDWGVMVKGSCYGEGNMDYYGILKEVLKVEYYSTQGWKKSHSSVVTGTTLKMEL